MTELARGFRAAHERGRRHGQRGQALVEFALAIPVVLLLLLSLFDAGRVFYAQNAITEAARDGVRVGVVSPSYTQAKYDTIRSAVVAMAHGFAITAANVTGQTGNCPSGAVDPSGTCFYPEQVTAGSRVVVNVAVPVQLITPIIANILGGAITVHTESAGIIQCTGC